MNKDEQLKMFLGSLPLEKAMDLAEAVERQKLADPKGLPADSILDGLRPQLRSAGPSNGRRVPTAQRFFTEVFEGLIVDDAGDAARTARVSRSSVQPIWNWLMSAEGAGLKKEADAVSAAILSNKEDGLASAIEALDTAAAKAVSDAIAVAGKGGKPAKKLVGALGGEIVYENLREAGRCLQIAKEIRELRRTLPALLDDIDDDGVETIRGIYEATAERAPGCVPYLVLSMLPRFSQPWSVFGLTAKLIEAKDDEDVKNSDLGLVGERLMTDLETLAIELAALRPADFRPATGSRILNAFALLQAGMTKEVGMQRSGSWGSRLLKSRGKVSSAMESLLSRAVKDIQLALPTRKAPANSKGGPRIADTTALAGEDVRGRALQLAMFFAGARDYAGNLGFSVAYNDRRTELIDYLDEYGSLLVEAVAKAEDPDDDIHRLLAETVLGTAEPLFSEEANAVLIRRMETARKRKGQAAADA